MRTLQRAEAALGIVIALEPFLKSNFHRATEDKPSERLGRKLLT